MAREYYAISCKQPWALALVMGIKTVETRFWRVNYRGPLLIHASKTYDYVGEKALAPFMHLLQEARHLRGGVIGMIDLYAIVRYQMKVLWLEHLDKHRCPAGWWQKGLYGWVVRNPRRLRFVPVRGQQRLFKVRLGISGAEKPFVLG